MKTQPTDTITINIKEVNIVKVGKAKHDELTQKADRAELVAAQKTLAAHQNTLTDHAERLDTKLDESQVKALIAEAELDDLTLEQVQQEVIKQVVDKASTQAMMEANQAQDAKIDTLTKQLEQQQAEAVELERYEEELLVDQSNVDSWQNQPKRYLKIGDYYVPFFKKNLFKVKKDVFALTLVKNQEYELPLEYFFEDNGNPLNAEFISDNDKVVAADHTITITTGESIESTITSRSLDKDVVLNITVVDDLDWQKVADSLEIKTVYGDKGVYVNEILPKHAPVDQIRYVFDRDVSGGRDSSYRTYRNIDGRTLVMDGQDRIQHGKIMSYPSGVLNANLSEVKIVKDGQSCVKTFEPQEIKPSVGVGV